MGEEQPLVGCASHAFPLNLLSPIEFTIQKGHDMASVQCSAASPVAPQWNAYCSATLGRG